MPLPVYVRPKLSLIRGSRGEYTELTAPMKRLPIEHMPRITHRYPLSAEDVFFMDSSDVDEGDKFIGYVETQFKTECNIKLKILLKTHQ